MTIKILALLLVLIGIVGLVHGGVTCTRTSHDAEIGAIELSVKDKETIHVPIWAGIGGIAVGRSLIFVRTRPRPWR